jgi:hypothetical protein
VRGYKEHHYKYIFVFERLNLGKLAMASGLLRVHPFPPLMRQRAAYGRRFALRVQLKLMLMTGRAQLPSMPETRNKKVDDFTPIDIELSAVPYTDKKKEKQRKVKLAKSLAEEAEKRAKVGKRGADVKNSAPWSRNQLKKEKRDKRKMLKDNKRKRIEEIRMGLGSGKQEQGDDDGDGEEDWKELENDLKEERLLKKLKRGKISKAEFEKRTGERDLEEEFESELAKEEQAAQAKAAAAAAATKKRSSRP